MGRLGIIRDVAYLIFNSWSRYTIGGVAHLELFCVKGCLVGDGVRRRTAIIQSGLTPWRTACAPIPWLCRQVLLLRLDEVVLLKQTFETKAPLEL